MACGQGARVESGCARALMGSRCGNPSQLRQQGERLPECIAGARDGDVVVFARAQVGATGLKEGGRGVGLRAGCGCVREDPCSQS